MSTHSYSNTQYNSYGTTQYNAGYSAGRASAGGGSSGGSTSNTLSTSYGEAKLNTAATYTAKELCTSFGAGDGWSSSSVPQNTYLVFRGATPTASACLGVFSKVGGQVVNASMSTYVQVFVNQSSSPTVTVNGTAVDSTIFTLCEYT